jgi:hypothetical protein
MHVKTHTLDMHSKMHTLNNMHFLMQWRIVASDHPSQINDNVGNDGGEEWRHHCCHCCATFTAVANTDTVTWDDIGFPSLLSLLLFAGGAPTPHLLSTNSRLGAAGFNFLPIELTDPGTLHRLLMLRVRVGAGAAGQPCDTHLGWIHIIPLLAQLQKRGQQWEGGGGIAKQCC